MMAHEVFTCLLTVVLPATPNLAFVSKSKALVAIGNSDIFTISIYVNRMTKHLAGNMLTNAEGEHNSLRKMWMRSVHGEFCLCLSIGDIMVMLSAVSVLVITLVKKLSKYNCADVYTLFLSILSSSPCSVLVPSTLEKVDKSACQMHFQFIMVQNEGLLYLSRRVCMEQIN